MNRSEEKSKLYAFFLQECNVDLEQPDKIPAVMIELAHKVVAVILALIEVPNHKIAYVIKSQEFATGLRDHISAYGIRYTRVVHDTLVEAVQQRLTHGNDIEYEWSEEQYNNFVVWKPGYEK